jgi:predicted Rossmann fold nucleotide-binding protein DprA/Smf involved in DNA uptake
MEVPPDVLAVLVALSAKPKPITALLAQTNLPLPDLLAALAVLETRGLAAQRGTNWHRTKRDA